MAVLFLMIFFAGNAEFFEMVDERVTLGHSWHYVGRTEVTDDYIALPAVEHDETRVFYWEIKQ